MPNTPFKSTSAWSMLAFKRALRWAVENGYDKIAWTTGEMQNERYDLSKHVGKVLWDEDTKTLTAWNPELTNTVIQESGVTAEKLPDYIGKEAAEKLVNMTPDEDNARELSGLDLKIGGEGMIGFYDNILPKAVNKYVKRFGGRVTTTDIQTAPEQAWSVFRNGERKQLFDSKRDAEQYIARYPERNRAEFTVARVDKRGTTVHALEITPAMRESVMQGQPLFSISDLRALARVEYASDLVDGVTSTITDDGHLNLSEHASEMVRRTLAEMSNTNEQPFDGATITGNTLKRIARRLESFAADLDANGYDSKPVRELADNLKKTAGNNYSVLYVYEEALPEETVHVQDLNAGRTDAQALAKLKESPFWTNPGDKFTKQYPRISDADKASEIAAKLATDQASKYGWDKIADFEAEKQKFLNEWANGIIRRNLAKLQTEDQWDDFTKSYPTITQYGGNKKSDTRASGKSGTSGTDTKAGEKEGTAQTEQKAVEGAESPSQEEAQQEADRRLPADGKLKPRKTVTSLEERGYIAPGDITGENRYYQTISRDAAKAVAQERIERIGLAHAVAEAIQPAETVSSAEQAFRMEVAELLFGQAAELAETNVEASAAKYNDAFDVIATLAVESTAYGQAISQLANWTRTNPQTAVAYLARRRKKNNLDPLSPEQAQVIVEDAQQVAEYKEQLDKANDKVADLEADVERLDAAITEAQETVNSQKRSLTVLRRLYSYWKNKKGGTAKRQRKTVRERIAELEAKKADALERLRERFGTDVLKSVADTAFVQSVDRSPALYDRKTALVNQLTQVLESERYIPFAPIADSGLDAEAEMQRYEQDLTKLRAEMDVASKERPFKADGWVHDMWAKRFKDYREQEERLQKRIERLQKEEPNTHIVELRQLDKELAYEERRLQNAKGTENIYRVQRNIRLIKEQIDNTQKRLAKFRDNHDLFAKATDTAPGGYQQGVAYKMNITGGNTLMSGRLIDTDGRQVRLSPQEQLIWHHLARRAFFDISQTVEALASDVQAQRRPPFYWVNNFEGDAKFSQFYTIDLPTIEQFLAEIEPASPNNMGYGLFGSDFDLTPKEIADVLRDWQDRDLLLTWQWHNKTLEPFRSLIRGRQIQHTAYDIQFNDAALDTDELDHLQSFVRELRGVDTQEELDNITNFSRKGREELQRIVEKALRIQVKRASDDLILKSVADEPVTDDVFEMLADLAELGILEDKPYTDLMAELADATNGAIEPDVLSQAHHAAMENIADRVKREREDEKAKIAGDPELQAKADALKATREIRKEHRQRAKDFLKSTGQAVNTFERELIARAKAQNLPEYVVTAAMMFSDKSLSQSDITRKLRERYPNEIKDGAAAMNAATKAAKFRSDVYKELRDERAAKRAEKNEASGEAQKAKQTYNNAFGKFRKRMEGLEKAPPSRVDRIIGIRKGLMVSALSTMWINVVGGAATSGLKTTSDIFTLALNKGLAQFGMESVAPDAIAAQVQFRELLGLDRDGKLGLDAVRQIFREARAAAHLAASHEFSDKTMSSRAQQVLNENPEWVDELFRAYNSDIEAHREVLRKSFKEAVGKEKIGAGVDAALDMAEYIADKANFLNRFQEFLIRNIEFDRALNVALANRGISLAKTIENKEWGNITGDDLAYAVRSALEVTYALRPKPGTAGATLVNLGKGTYKIPMMYVAPFANFIWNASRQVAQYTPGVGIAQKVLRSKNENKEVRTWTDAMKTLSPRDAANQIIGTSILIGIASMLRSIGSDDDDWKKIKVPFMTDQDGKQMYVDVGNWWPLTPFFWMANKINRTIDGKPLFSSDDPEEIAFEILEATVGINERTFDATVWKLVKSIPGAGSDVVSAAFTSSSLDGLLSKLATSSASDGDVAKVWYNFQKLGGEEIGIVTRPFKSFKDIAAFVDTFQKDGKENADLDLLDFPFEDAATKNVPFRNTIWQAAGAKPKKRVTGEDMQQPRGSIGGVEVTPALRIFGYNFTSDYRRKEPTPAIKKARSFMFEPKESDGLPESRRTSMWKGQIYRMIEDAGQDTDKQIRVREIIDSAESRGMFTAQSADRMRSMVGKTPIQAAVVGVSRKQTGNKPSPFNQVLALANETELTELLRMVTAKLIAEQTKREMSAADDDPTKPKKPKKPSLTIMELEKEQQTIMGEIDRRKKE
ncbi:MAG: hypothetical protein E6Q97_13695 [Desulfurellales bacterium]|nr:MAG: hypothetical protein E6Q97_13695 [Desulfurellales bacterium]